MPIYRKTAKGLTEIESRAHRLPPRLRSALIIVDGRRSAAELHPLILQQPQETLGWLLEQGFIEAVPGTPAAASSFTPAVAPSVTPPVSPSVAPSASPAGDDFTRARAEAVRLLTQLVGPEAEALAMRMERTRNADELRPLLSLAVQSVANMRGRQAAQDYAAKLSAL
jgi:hypothetical protein